MTDGNADPPRDAGLPPGYDEDDPYEGVDLSTYPAWWRHNVREFRDHGMRPYRPARFADGTVAPEAVEALAAELGVEIRFRVRNPQDGGQWELAVDGRSVREIDHERSGDGYTVYDIDAEGFERAVRGAVGDGG